jgi:single-strand DNA-binding protein
MRNITLVGNLTRDFEVRFFEDSAVANSAVAVNHRFKDQKTGEWKDSDKPHYFDIAVWGSKQVDNVVDSLGKGDRVLVVGNVNMTQKEMDDGTKKTYTEVRVEHIGPELRWASASVTRNPKGGGTSTSKGPEAEF